MSAWIIGFVLVAIVTVLIVILVKANIKDEKSASEEDGREIDPSCCGAHEVCDFDKVKVDVDKIEYFEDEDLDEYASIAEDRFTDEQIDEFREVLYSLQTEEIQRWLLSLTRRRIHLPSILNDEARDLMVNG